MYESTITRPYRCPSTDSHSLFSRLRSRPSGLATAGTESLGPPGRGMNLVLSIPMPDSSTATVKYSAGEGWTMMWSPVTLSPKALQPCHSATRFRRCGRRLAFAATQIGQCGLNGLWVSMCSAVVASRLSRASRVSAGSQAYFGSCSSQSPFGVFAFAHVLHFSPRFREVVR